MPCATNLPPAAGIGLKPVHYSDVLEAGRGGPLSFIEVHPQNYFGAGGPPHRWLTACAEIFPLSFHSVGLSLGRAEGCDRDELERLAQLCDRYQPSAVSDHLSWSATPDERMPDLLPVPMTRAVLAHVAAEVSRAQDRLRRPLLIENPSHMLAFAGDELSEPEFLTMLARETGCGLLLDINNIEVSAINLGFSAWDYLDAIPAHLVGEVHLAGHALERHAGGALAIDDHGSPVSPLTWRLYQALIRRAGPLPTLIEWDNNIPPFKALVAEADKAQHILEEAARVAA